MSIFTNDVPCIKEHIIIEGKKIESFSKLISADVSDEVKEKGAQFASEIEERFVSDFEKSEKLFNEGKVNERDFMAHVSTFVYTNGMIFMTYYANTKEAKEDPDSQTARLVYCKENDVENKVFLDIMGVGDDCDGKKVEMVYDTILMKKDDDTLMVLWTAKVGGNYYRLCRSFTISSETLGPVVVNRFKVGEITNDFSTTGIKAALAENEIGYKKMYSDIGIMQKLSYRVENGVKYYYSGAYSGDFTCIIKSADFVTWEYVSQPDFLTESKWENATYVLDDKVYYFVRQQDDVTTGFLTYYDLKTGKWESPVLIEDCQSRSDFIVYNDKLYLFHAPIGREHIGVVCIDRENLADSYALLQAKMHTSCFYPFVDFNSNGELSMSYTVARKHIRLAEFTLSKYTK